MKIGSVSGITCYVADLAETARFYETLGFRRGKDGPDRLTFYVNWFFLTFIARDTAAAANEAPAVAGRDGIFAYLKVDDVDAVHAELLASGLKPESEPRAEGRNQREFVLRDPDGYQLVFFEKK